MNFNFLLVFAVTSIKAPTIIIPRYSIGKAGINSSGVDGCEGVSGGEYPFMLISKTYGFNNVFAHNKSPVCFS